MATVAPPLFVEATTILKVLNHHYPHQDSPDTFERLKTVIQITAPEESIQTTAAHHQPRPQVLTPQD